VANPALSIDFQPMRVSHDIQRMACVAKLTYSPLLSTDPKQDNGQIIVSNKKGEQLVIPYSVEMLRG